MHAKPSDSALYEHMSEARCCLAIFLTSSSSRNRKIIIAENRKNSCVSEGAELVSFPNHAPQADALAANTTRNWSLKLIPISPWQTTTVDIVPAMRMLSGQARQTQILHSTCVKTIHGITVMVRNTIIPNMRAGIGTKEV